MSVRSNGESSVAPARGLWNTYTPLVNSNFLGGSFNYTISGSYVQIGKTVHFKVQFIINAAGSTGVTTGTNPMHISLPVKAKTATSDYVPVARGVGLITATVDGSGNSATRVSYELTGHLMSTDGYGSITSNYSTIKIKAPYYAVQSGGSGTNYIRSTPISVGYFPYGLLNGDTLEFTGTYEAD